MELSELIELVESMRQSDLWGRSRAASQVLAEVPFHVYFSAIEARAKGLLGPAAEALPQSVEGVIDLAFREPAGWIIADYKTDHFASDTARQQRIRVYQKQVDLYALCWEHVTGEPVIEKALFFTNGNETVVWKSEEG